MKQVKEQAMLTSKKRGNSKCKGPGVECASPVQSNKEMILTLLPGTKVLRT